MRRSCLLLLLLCCIFCLSAHSDERKDGLFCKNGAYPATNYAGYRKKFDVWGSYCEKGDNDILQWESPLFEGKSTLSVLLAGHPSTSGNSLAVIRISDTRTLTLVPATDPSLELKPFHFSLPSDFLGEELKIQAIDNATGAQGWFAIALPDEVIKHRHRGSQPLSLLLGTIVIFIGFILPGIVAASLIYRKNKTEILSLPFLVISPAILGYLSFWLYLYDPLVGNISGIILLIASLVGLILNFRLIANFFKDTNSWFPITLMLLSLIFLICSGLLHGGSQRPLQLAQLRYTAQSLPGDNHIPLQFAKGILGRNIPVPLHADWLSSDRPPLQTGITLYLWPLHSVLPLREELFYEIIAVTCQLLWIVALWISLHFFGLGNSITILVLLGTLFSPPVFQNSFYVWPKMLAGSFLVLLVGLIFAPVFEQARKNWLSALQVGALAAFGMLSHGAAFFGLIGVGLSALFMLRIPKFGWLLASVLTMMLLYLPWTTYQKTEPFIDRLAKTHLAGVEPLNLPVKSLAGTIVDAYLPLSWPQIINNKIDNILAIFGHPFTNSKHFLSLIYEMAGTSSESRINGYNSVYNIRYAQFFSLFDSAGPVLLFGILPLVLYPFMKKSTELRVGGTFAFLLLVNGLVWALLMFGPFSCVIHQGSYLLPLLFTPMLILCLHNLNSYLSYFCVIVTVMMNLLVYTFYPPIGRILDNDSIISDTNIDSYLFGLAMISFCAIVVLSTAQSKVNKNQRAFDG